MGRAKRAAYVVAWLLAVAPTARAEIAVLQNGQVLKIAERRVDGETTFLALRDGGEVGLPAALVRGFVPDEVMDEVHAAATAGSELPALAIAAAQRHGLDPALVLAVVGVESAFAPNAVSPKGAQGLMQLMPGTAATLGVADAFDPAQNLDAGVRHLRSLVGRYRGDLRRALAAYNAGEGAVSRHGGVPPYRETRDYVRRVMARYRKDP
jgi:hypothetical protein